MDVHKSGTRQTLIYVVDDDQRLAGTVCGLLSGEGYTTRSFHDGSSVLSAVRDAPPELVVLDLMLPDLEGTEVLKKLQVDMPGLPVVMMSGKGTISTAVEAVKLGAYDFIEKPLDANRLKVAVRNAVESGRLRNRITHLEQEVAEGFAMVCISPAMKDIREDINRIAASPACVLITGESGVGKEVAARAIHLESPRSTYRFVALNCAAIPQELIESELFGHQKGAFTGATASRHGKLLLADKGTLFLDEVGDMSLPVQAKLLRFLETKEVQPLGSTSSVFLDVRIIAATNKNLAECITQHSFREDLYYRLNVVTIDVPPLRERREAIGPLVEHFWLKLGSELHRPDVELSPEARRALESYHWPGNVREVRNVVERLLLLARTNPITAKEARSFLTPLPCSHDDSTLRSARGSAECQAAERALALAHGNVTKASRILGIKRQSLYRIMKRCGLRQP